MSDSRCYMPLSQLVVLVALWVRCRIAIKRSWVRLWSRCGCTTTLDKLFTPMYPDVDSLRLIRYHSVCATAVFMELKLLTANTVLHNNHRSLFKACWKIQFHSNSVVSLSNGMCIGLHHGLDVCECVCVLMRWFVMFMFLWTHVV